MSQIRDELNSHHLKTLKALENKTDVSWTSVQNLLLRIGAKVKGNDGSRIKACFNGAVLCLHKPHGKAENHLTPRNMRDVRNFLHAAHVL